MKVSIRRVTQSHKEAFLKSPINLLVELNSLFVAQKVKTANKHSVSSVGLQNGILAESELSPNIAVQPQPGALTRWVKIGLRQL